MATEKKITVNTFVEAVNVDSADQFIPQTQVRSLTNMRIFGSGKVGVATSIMGNTAVTNPLPAGTNKCIGYGADESRGRLFFLNYNSNGYHGLYFYDIGSNTITQVLLNLTDTNGVDIMKLNPAYPVYHFDIVDHNKAYWCDYGLNVARKTNIDRCIDKTSTGYGTVITEDFITAYKQAPVFSPTWRFITDVTKSSNYIYGIQFKACYRFYFFDNEMSDCSPYSDVPLPPNESYLGIGDISFNNNAVEWTMETGSRDVTKIELLIKINSNDWTSINVFNKADLGIPDYATFVFTFFNDGPLVSVDQLQVLRAFSSLPDTPKCQSFLNKAMSYANFKEGFPVVHIDATIACTFTPFYLPSGTTSQLNNPAFTESLLSTTESGGLFNSWFTTVTRFLVGVDVKKGNIFYANSTGGNGSKYFSYTANNGDTAATVAAVIKQWLRTIDSIGTSTITNESSAGGNAQWDFTIEAHEGKNAITFSTHVVAVNFSTLLDNGLSINSIKQGASRKYGIIFYNTPGGKTSDTYTANSLLIRTPFQTEFGADGVTPIGLQQPIHTITITSLPPSWATHFSIVRTNDTATFIQMLIQQVTVVTVANQDTYLDMIVGSLFTYQAIHPDTILKYEFKRGDRLRLISDQSVMPPTLYTPFYETEVLSYSDSVTEYVGSNISVPFPASNNVTPTIAPDAQHIGKFIIINGVQRLITNVSGADYVLDEPLQPASNSSGTGVTTVYPNYSYLDTRGIVRIKKPPAGYTFGSGAMPLVEIYTPEDSLDAVTYLNFLDFQQKYPIVNGAYTGNIQNQDPANPVTTPAIIQITQGDSYVRNRALPTNNANPNPQVVIAQIADPNFSDFYQSNLYGTGRIYAQDQGFGVVDFTQRVRFSNNYIEGTRVNGLNNFNNLDREDYNDQYGSINLTRMRGDYLYLFKPLKTTWTPVLKRIISDNAGNDLLQTSNKLLNELQYSAWEGGIGNNPESWIDDGTYQKFASANSGVFIRIAQDGSIPISSLYLFDKKARDILSEIAKNNVKIEGVHDRLNGEDLWAIPSYTDYIFNGNFYTNDWDTTLALYPGGTTWAIISQPANSTATVVGNMISITGTSTLGDDSFTFQGTLPAGGGTTPIIHFCFTVIADPNPQLIWVIDASTDYCSAPGGSNNGQQGWKILDEQIVSTGALTGRIMPNAPNISPDAIVPNTATITFNPNTDVAPSGGANGNIWYNGLSDALYKKISGTWALLVNKVVNTNFVPTITNTGACPVTPPANNFNLDSSYNTPFTSLVCTGAPTFTFPTSINVNTGMNFTGTIPLQVIQVGLGSGSPIVKKLDLVINGTVVDTRAGITGAGVYNLNMPSTPDTSIISIQINT